MSARGGIDLGGTKIQAVIVDEKSKPLGQSRGPTPRSGGPKDVAAAMAALLKDAATNANLKTSELEGVGVGSPGEVDAGDGTVTSARNLPDWEGTYELGPKLEKLLGTKIAIGNDVQVATDAEFLLGAARDYRTIVGVFWGTGVGGGLIFEGRRWLGRSSAGEIGHVVIQHSGGLKCPCGRHGCMEAYAGRIAMEARAHHRHHKGGEKTVLFKIQKQQDRPRLTSGVWARALEQDDEMAHELVDDAVRALGAGIASAVNLIDPEAVIIGGGMGLKLGEPYLKKIVEAMRPHVFYDEMPAVHLAALGDLGGAIGASLLVDPKLGLDA